MMMAPDASQTNCEMARPAVSETSSPVKQPLADWQLVRQLPLPQKKCEDNYELSEPEDSDADEALVAERRAGKHQPRWCDSYLKALQEQADLDPDSIFGGRVPHCDLEEVFPTELYQQLSRNKPQRRRGSSGNWRRDHLTQGEVNAYKHKLGQNKAWVPDIDSMSPSKREMMTGLMAGRRPVPTPARQVAASSSDN